jgi:hypothetical protein
MTTADISCRLLDTAVALARSIRGNAATTCCCHICVDDPNYDDHHVAFCIQTAARREHADCLRLALLLASFSTTRRRKVNYRAWRD